MHVKGELLAHANLTPRESIPFLELNQISLVTTCQQEDHGGLHTAPVRSASGIQQVLTSVEKENLIADLAYEKEKMPIILSVIDPCNAKFITTDEHLPPIFSTLYDPANLNKNYSELLKIAAVVDQSKSKQWFKYRAGRITASRFRQIIHINPYQPSVSLLNSICYPEINRFSSDATKWGCVYEAEAIRLYEEEHNSSHHNVFVNPRSMSVSIIPFWVRHQMVLLNVAAVVMAL